MLKAIVLPKIYLKICSFDSFLTRTDAFRNTRILFQGSPPRKITQKVKYISLKIFVYIYMKSVFSRLDRWSLLDRT